MGGAAGSTSVPGLRTRRALSRLPCVRAGGLLSELRPLPAGRRVIMMRTHTATFIDTDSADFIDGAALRRACTGADAHFGNFSGLW